MFDPSTSSPNAVPPPRKRRWLRRIIVFAPLVLAGVYFYNLHRGKQALAEAIAKTERLDPGWRLEDIEKRRAQLPDEENAAIHIAAAAKLIPETWLQNDEDLWDLVDGPPQCQLDAKGVDRLRLLVLNQANPEGFGGRNS